MAISSDPGDAPRLLDWVSRLKEAAATGELLDLAPGEEVDPADAGSWGPNRCIPAGALREVLTTRDPVVDPRGLRIRGARFRDALDLRFVVFPHPLHLVDCALDASADANGARFLELDIQGTHCRSGMSVSRSEITGSVFAQGFTTEGGFDASDAEIGETLSLDGAILHNPGGIALIVDGAKITGGMFAREPFQARGEVRAAGATIDGQLNLRGAILHNPSDIALNVEAINVSGSFVVRNGFEAIGQVHALGARIGGQLDLTGAILNNPGDVALRLDRAHINGDVFARNGFRAEGEVRAQGATIGGQLEMDAATLHNPAEIALMLEAATITGSLFARDGFNAEGKVHALGIKIGGQLNFNGATLRNPSGVALDLDRADISGGMFAGAGLDVAGQVRAPVARIGGALVLSGAVLGNPGGVALSLDGADITGSLFAGDGFEAEGEVRAAGASINGQLDLSAAVLRNPDGSALTLDGAHITGSLFAGDGFDVEGEVQALGATIGGRLDLDGATLCHPDGIALNLDSSSIKSLRLEPVALRGSVNLRLAVIGELITGHLVTANEPPQLEAIGWQIADLHGSLREDWSAARRWLDTNPAKVISIQPWHALADVYERNGDPARARRLRFAAANRLTRQSPWPAKILRCFYGALVGHGYYPLLALGWLIAVIVAGWILVATAREIIVPANEKDATAAVNAHALTTRTAPPADPITAQTPCESHPGYPCLNPLTFALNGLAPASVSPASSSWMIKPDATWLTLALDGLKLFAWALAALLLAGVTGLLRKT